MPDRFATGGRVIVTGYTGIHLACTVVYDGGGPQVLVRHEPPGDQLLVSLFTVPRQRVRAADPVTPSDAPR